MVRFVFFLVKVVRLSNAFLLPQGVPDLSDFGNVYEFGFGVGPEKPPTSAIIRKEFQHRILYQLSPLEVIKKKKIRIIE